MMEQFSPTEISFYLMIITGSFLYFGKIIGDTKVEKYDKLSYYIEGLTFSIIFFFLPLIVAWYLFSHAIIFNSLSLQLFILCCLYLNIRIHEILRKYGLLGEFKKRLRKKLNNLKKDNSIIGLLIRKENWFKKRIGIDYVECNVKFFYNYYTKFFSNSLLLLLFSFTSIWLSISLLNENFLKIAVSFTLTFFILTMIALSYGFSTTYYPPIKVRLKNGKTIKGKLLKFGEFVYLLSGKKKIFVNSSEISIIEMNLFKSEKL